MSEWNLPRDLVRQAITDIQGSIQANDQKSAAGLVAQAFLTAAVVGLVTQLGSIHKEGTEAARVLIDLALGGTMVFGVLSISFLIIAVMPYEPGEEFAARNKRGGVYFPQITKLTGKWRRDDVSELDQLKPKFEDLRKEDQLHEEYLSELLMVANIRHHEARWGKIGFRFLLVEVVCVVIYLITIGAVAEDVFGAAAASPPASLRWEVVQKGHRQSLATVDGLVLPYPKAQVQLRFEDPAGERHAKLTRAATYHCAAGKRRGRRRILKPVTQNAQLFGAKHAVLVESAAISRLRCPRKTRLRRVVWRFRGETVSESGALTVGLFRLRMVK
jgi:hypothetical protein